MKMTMQVALAVEYAAPPHASGDIEGGNRIASISGYVAGAEAIAYIRRELRLVGAEVTSSVTGSEPVLRLALEELAIAAIHGSVALVVTDTDQDDGIDTEVIREALCTLVQASSTTATIITLPSLSRVRIRIFADLWQRGHYVAFGSKFGVDYLVYHQDPSTCHSFAMVLVKEYTATFASVDLVSHCRVAKMVKKQLVVASEHNHQIVFMTIDHAILATQRR